MIERCDEQDRINVGSHDLLGVGIAGRAPGKLYQARQHSMDVGPWTLFWAGLCLAWPEPGDDPVAHRRQFAAGGRPVKKPPGALGGEFTVDRQQLIGVLVLERDAGGQEVGGGEGLEGIREVIVPAESGESH